MRKSAVKVVYVDDKFEVTANGETMWVNSHASGAVGRFSPRGVDVHNTENSACVNCSPVPNWQAFVEGMRRVHGIDLSELRRELPWVEKESR